MIGRTTKKLVQGCLKTLQTGKKAKVLGKNIGENIAAVVTKLAAKRIRYGVLALLPDLSNLLEMLDEYKLAESRILQESREHPDMALSELEDKVETVKSFFTAYMRKCFDESSRVPEDPPCAFNRTVKDFKEYIYGLFSDDEGSKNFILFMTAHRSKGGEWDHVYIIGADEFPHPKAKSDRQKQQESNLMYVAITRAIETLSFVGAPFQCLSVSGYEPAGPLTIVSFPVVDHVEVHPDTDLNVDEKRSIYNEPGFEDYDPEVVDALFSDTFLHHDEIDRYPMSIEVAIVEPIVEELEPGKISRVLSIEVLCPGCNRECLDSKTGSLSITPDLVGHTVICSVCGKSCIVPLNAFSLSFQGEVVAREKPALGVTNSQREKVGRTPKERKAKSGRKTKSGAVRQPMQLSLDVQTISVLNAMGVNKSELYEELLQQYEPYLEMLADMKANGDFDHDEIQDGENEDLDEL